MSTHENGSFMYLWVRNCTNFRNDNQDLYTPTITNMVPSFKAKTNELNTKIKQTWNVDKSRLIHKQGQT